MDKLLYRVVEAAAVLGIGRTKTYELVASGQLRSVLIGRARRIPVDALNEFVAALKSETPGAPDSVTNERLVTPTPTGSSVRRPPSHREPSGVELLVNPQAERGTPRIRPPKRNPGP